MGRHVGRHAHGNTAGTIDQKVRKAGWKDRRLLLGAVIVFAKIDSILFDIIKHRHGNLRHTGFRVAHGCRWITIDGAEITLTVNQRQPQRKILGHAYQGVINRLVAMGMILTHDIADNTG